MTLHNNKFINMDTNSDGTWWIDYLDNTKEHPEIIRIIFETWEQADVFYKQLMTQQLINT